LLVVVLPESARAEDATALADEVGTTKDQALDVEHDEDLCGGVAGGVGAREHHNVVQRAQSMQVICVQGLAEADG
jgi:hypothetical protein